MKFQDVLKAQTTESMTTKEIAQFHAHNENGLFKTYHRLYKQLETLLDENKITDSQFCAIMYYDFNTQNLLRISELTRPQSSKLNTWIENAQSIINRLEDFLNKQQQAQKIEDSTYQNIVSKYPAIEFYLINVCDLLPAKQAEILAHIKKNVTCKDYKTIAAYVTENGQ